MTIATIILMVKPLVKYRIPFTLYIHKCITAEIRFVFKRNRDVKITKRLHRHNSENLITVYDGCDV